MASRKKADVVPTVEPTIEQPSEQPVTANVAPVPSLNVAPIKVERPAAARPSSSVRVPSKGNKGGAKSGGGKGSPNRGSGSGHYQETSTSKKKKKKAKKKGLKVMGSLLGEGKYRPSKKATKKGAQKRGLRK